MQHCLGLVSYELGADRVLSSLHAWVLDLPGCIAGGRDLKEVEQNLPLVIAEHEAWLLQAERPLARGLHGSIYASGPQPMITMQRSSHSPSGS